MLYGSPGSRSPLVDWYLTELGVAWEAAPPSDRDNPHPMGQVPALRDGDGVALFESGAILMYLADRYGGLDTPEARARAGCWVVWANATLDPVLFLEDDNGRVLGTGAAGDPRALRVLDDFLDQAEGDFLLGDFGVADVAVASYLLYALMFFPATDFSKWPRVSAYMARDRKSVV